MLASVSCSAADVPSSRTDASMAHDAIPVEDANQADRVARDASATDVVNGRDATGGDAVADEADAPGFQCEKITDSSISVFIPDGSCPDGDLTIPIV